MPKPLPLNLRKVPLQSRSRATVEAILIAATRIIEREGPWSFTTNAVADLAGVSIGTLYQYFPNKETILAALIRQEMEDLFQSLQAAMAASAGSPVADRIRALVGVAAARQVARPVLALHLDAAQARLPLEEDTARLQERIVALVQPVLSEAGVPSDQQRAAAAHLFGMVRGATDVAAGLEGAPMEALIERLTRAILAYLGVSHGSASRIGR